MNVLVLNPHSVRTSSISNVEPNSITTLILMAAMWRFMTPTQSVRLRNSMITGNNDQCGLIPFKRKYSYVKCGEIDIGYWNGFKKNARSICSNCNQKYTLD